MEVQGQLKGGVVKVGKGTEGLCQMQKLEGTIDCGFEGWSI